MLPLVPIVVVAYLALYAFAFSIPAHLRPSQRPLGDVLQLEKTDLGPNPHSSRGWKEKKRLLLTSCCGMLRLVESMLLMLLLALSLQVPPRAIQITTTSVCLAQPPSTQSH